MAEPTMREHVTGCDEPGCPLCAYYQLGQRDAQRWAILLSSVVDMSAAFNAGDAALFQECAGRVVKLLNEMPNMPGLRDLAVDVRQKLRVAYDVFRMRDDEPPESR